MAYIIRMGIPEMEKLWNKLQSEYKTGVIENKTGGAMRMYWVYGPNKQEITVIGLEPHPEDKKNSAYDRITLSDIGEYLT